MEVEEMRRRWRELGELDDRIWPMKRALEEHYLAIERTPFDPRQGSSPFEVLRREISNLRYKLERGVGEAVLNMAEEDTPNG